MLTNPRDAFSGQSRSSNMEPFELEYQTKPDNLFQRIAKNIFQTSGGLVPTCPLAGDATGHHAMGNLAMIKLAITEYLNVKLYRFLKSIT